MDNILQKFKTLDTENVNKIGQDGFTMLMYFSKSDSNIIFVKALLENPNINFDIKNNNGESTIDIAMKNGCTQIMKLFEEKGYYVPIPSTRVSTIPPIQQFVREIPKIYTYLELVEKNDFKGYMKKLNTEMPDLIPDNGKFMEIAIKNKSLEFLNHFFEGYAILKTVNRTDQIEYQYPIGLDVIISNLNYAFLSKDKAIVEYLLEQYKSNELFDVVDKNDIEFYLFENALTFGDLEIVKTIFKLVENIATVSNLNFAVNYAISKEFMDIHAFLLEKRGIKLSNELIDFVSKNGDEQMLLYVKNIIEKQQMKIISKLE